MGHGRLVRRHAEREPLPKKIRRASKQLLDGLQPEEIEGLTFDRTEAHVDVSHSADWTISRLSSKPARSNMHQSRAFSRIMMVIVVSFAGSLRCDTLLAHKANLIAFDVSCSR